MMYSIPAVHVVLRGSSSTIPLSGNSDLLSHYGRLSFVHTQRMFPALLAVGEHCLYGQSKATLPYSGQKTISNAHECFKKKEWVYGTWSIEECCLKHTHTHKCKTHILACCIVICTLVLCVCVFEYRLQIFNLHRQGVGQPKILYQMLCNPILLDLVTCQSLLSPLPGLENEERESKNMEERILVG